MSDKAVVICLRNSGSGSLDIPTTYAEFFHDRVEGYSVEHDEHFTIDVVNTDFVWQGLTYSFCSVRADI